jgi:mannose-6-phosphate isomerase-like protein (cupin superfamily)
MNWPGIRLREGVGNSGGYNQAKIELLRAKRHLDEELLTMADTKTESLPRPEYPYVTHLNVHYPPLEVVDVPALVAACTDRWYNQTLCRVNDSVVRLGVMQGEYHWHSHHDLDEFFYVVEGKFLIDLEGRSVELGPRQGFVVPKGVVHRTRAPERTVVLMVEGAGIVPTGD